MKPSQVAELYGDELLTQVMICQGWEWHWMWHWRANEGYTFWKILATPQIAREEMDEREPLPADPIKEPDPFYFYRPGYLDSVSEAIKLLEGNYYSLSGSPGLSQEWICWIRFGVLSGAIGFGDSPQEAICRAIVNAHYSPAQEKTGRDSGSGAGEKGG